MHPQHFLPREVRRQGTHRCSAFCFAYSSPLQTPTPSVEARIVDSLCGLLRQPWLVQWHDRNAPPCCPLWSSLFSRCSPAHWHQSLRRFFGGSTDEDSLTTICLGATVRKHGALVVLCRAGLPGTGEAIEEKTPMVYPEDGHKKRSGIPIAPSGTESAAGRDVAKRTPPSQTSGD